MTVCKLGDILAESSDKEREVLAAAVSDRETWSARALSNAINKTKYSIGATTVKDHRRKQCGCYQ